MLLLQLTMMKQVSEQTGPAALYRHPLAPDRGCREPQGLQRSSSEPTGRSGRRSLVELMAEQRAAGRLFPSALEGEEASTLSRVPPAFPGRREGMGRASASQGALRVSGALS
jgi:hypothetical protein